MENKGLVAYTANNIEDRREFLKKDFFYSEPLTITNAKYGDHKNLVVEFQKRNGKSVVYIFSDEHAKREFVADIVGYESSNPYPQNFMKLENMFGKKAEGFFSRRFRMFISVAPIFPHCNDKKYLNSIKPKDRANKKGKGQEPAKEPGNLLKELGDLYHQDSLDPTDPNLHNQGYPKSHKTTDEYLEDILGEDFHRSDEMDFPQDETMS